jgi:hypothetical protein
MDWNGVMDRIEANEECAIVHDVQQEAEGKHPGWDVWIDGHLSGHGISEADAETQMRSLLRDRDEHEEQVAIPQPPDHKEERVVVGNTTSEGLFKTGPLSRLSGNNQLLLIGGSAAAIVGLALLFLWPFIGVLFILAGVVPVMVALGQGHLVRATLYGVGVVLWFFVEWAARIAWGTIKAIARIPFE